MNRFRSTLAGALAATLLVTGAAAAQGPRAGGPGLAGRAGGVGRGMGGELPLGALNLTQAQQDLIRDIRQKGQQDARQFDERLRAAQEAQRKALDANPLNEGQIRAATQALAEVQADLAIHRARVQHEIFAALTAEQQAQVQKLRAQREQRMQQRQAQVRERRGGRANQ